MAEEVNKDTLNINTGSVAFSLYAQISIINMTKTDMTVDFVYVHPQTRMANTVSRITMPLLAAKELRDNIDKALNHYKASSTSSEEIK